MDQNSNQRGITSRIIVEMSRKIFRRWRAGLVGKYGGTELCPSLNVVVMTEETSKMIMGGRIVLEGDDVCGWFGSGLHGDYYLFSVR
mmetsp:Transcript_28385/g.46071  ORF Transcript_28385/g.46071 Transcript_28385/m.46071 type:complete len:87 (-) Transcript_28385:22-282(-)